MAIEIFHNSQGIAGGLKFTGGGKSAEITPRQGTAMGSLIADQGSHNELWWEWRPGNRGAAISRIGIAANKQIPEGELLKIAESFEY